MVMDPKRPDSLPTGRTSRLFHLGSVVASIAGGVVADGLRQLAISVAAGTLQLRFVFQAPYDGHTLQSQIARLSDATSWGAGRHIDTQKTCHCLWALPRLSKQSGIVT